MARRKRSGSRSGWRRWAGRLAGALLALAGVAGSPAAAVILAVEPAPGAVLLAPDLTVRVAFAPPVAPGESVAAVLFPGADDTRVDRVMPREVSGSALVSPDGAKLAVELTDLPPGRSTLEVVREGAAGEVDRLALVLDRGGVAQVGVEPFRAGVRTFQVERPSTLDPGTLRRFDVFVWYPTEAAGAVDPATEALPDAPLAPGAERLPTVLFSHGSCGSPIQSTNLTAGFARRGYLVAAMEHPGNTFLDPNCPDPLELARAFAERPDDVRATLDWLLAEGASPGSFLAGVVDPDRVGLTGHSFGGQTTVRVAAVDARFAAAMPLAPEFAFTAPAVLPLLPLPVPALVQGGSLDTTTPFETHQLPLYRALAPPRFLVEILAADHGGFTRFAPPEIRALVERYAYAFFGAYLARDRRHDADLGPAPEVRLTVDRSPLLPPPPCANGLDDDGDARVDAFSDPGCDGDPEGAESLVRPVAGRRLVLRDPAGGGDRRLLSLVARETDLPVPAPGSSGDPRSVGAVLAVEGAAAPEATAAALPAAGWSALAGGGYRYLDRTGALGPCRAVLLTARGLRAVCRGAGAGPALEAPAQGEVAVRLEVGTEVRYCLRFGGEIRADRGAAGRRAGLFLARDAPPPPACEPGW